MPRISYFYTTHKSLIYSLLFLVVYSTTVVLAAPPTTPYYPTDNITDPTCSPTDTNCYVSVFPDQTSNTGKLLFTDGTNPTWASNLYWDETNDRLGIGISAPSYQLHIRGSAPNAVLERYSSDTTPGVFRGQKARGTVDTPLAVQTGDGLVFLRGSGWDGSTFQDAGMIAMYAAENFSGANNRGSYMTFSTATVGVASGSGGNERMRIDSNGNVGIGTISPTAKLHISDTDKTNLTLYSSSNFNIFTSDALAIDKGGALTLGGVYRTDGLLTGFASIKGAKENATHGHWGGYLSLYTSQNDVGSVERMRITSTGNVGIGTSAPVSIFHVGVAPTASANYGLVSLGNGAFDGTTSGFFTGSASGTTLAINNASGYAGDLLNIQIAGVSKLRSTSSSFTAQGSGSVNLATFTRTDAGEARLTIQGYSPSSIPAVQFIANNFNGVDYTPVTTGSTIGRIFARGPINSAGTYSAIGSPGVSFIASETWNASAYGSRINFSVTKTGTTIEATPLSLNNSTNNVLITGFDATSASAALSVVNSSASNLLYVRNDGRVGLGTSTPNTILELRSATSGQGRIGIFESSTGGGGIIAGTTNALPATNDRLAFFAASNSTSNGALVTFHAEDTWVTGTSYPTYMTIHLVPSGSDSLAEVFRISSAGNVGIGLGASVSPTYRLDVKQDSASTYATRIFHDGNATTRWGLLVQSGLDDHTAAGPSTLVAFQDGDGTAVGSITFGSSATAYNTTSDQRMKNLVNEQTLSSINILKDIKIHDFTWKDDINNNLYTGVFAQELYEIYPFAVTKPVNEENNWMVDYSKLTPIIIASVQELNIKVQDLSNISTDTPETLGSLIKSFIENTTTVFERVFVRIISSDEVNTKTLCVADDSGNKTCIDKSQLDAFLQSQYSSSTSIPASEPEPLITEEVDESTSASVEDSDVATPDSTEDSDVATPASAEGSSVATEEVIPSEDIVEETPVLESSM